MTATVGSTSKKFGMFRTSKDRNRTSLRVQELIGLSSVQPNPHFTCSAKFRYGSVDQGGD